MAHYAKLGLDNIVTAVIVVDNSDCMDSEGVESEDVGIAHLIKDHGHEFWKKCSYNTSEGVHRFGGTPFRANYPGKGWYYNSELDIFHQARPVDRDGVSCASWTLNATTGMWDAPITQPEITAEQVGQGKCYRWDETDYQADAADPKTVGWFLSDL
tara:strand:+ start:166 stop:633 length:468 start_codon:yes stop_codon:yes gene_type:complete